MLNEQVRVYYNLHRKCFSVQEKTKSGWRVVQHAEQVFLRDVEFIVYESGRQRVIQERKKNVHAYVNGTFINQPNFRVWEQVYYNPYKFSTFVYRDGTPIVTAEYVQLIDKRILIGID